MGKIESYIGVMVALSLIAVFQYTNQINYYLSQLDSVYMVENIDTTYAEGTPRSHVNWSAHKAISTVIRQRAPNVCAQPLTAEAAEFTTVFDRHAYGILYALAPMRVLASGPAIAAFAQALAYIGLICAVYVFLRRCNLSVLAVLPYIAFLVVHPAWSGSAFGQFYPDRLFLLAGFVYATLVYCRLTQESNNNVSILLMVLLAASITERSALMVSVFTLVALAIFRDRRSWSRNDQYLLTLALGVLFYAVVYMVLMQKNPDYRSYSNPVLSFFNHLMKNEAFRLKLMKFLVVNLPYLILSIFEWRMAIIALGAMLPNIFGSIGGAEKTGWSTHYHSMYFPFLIAASSMGYLRICNAVKNKKQKLLGIALLAAAIVFLAGLDPYTLSPLLNWRTQKWSDTHALPIAWGVLTNTGQAGMGIRLNSDFRRKVATYVPPGATVTTNEDMMPSLYGQGRILNYYPLALASADYAVLPYSYDDQGNMLVSGAVSYQGKKNREMLDACLNNRIWASNYEIVKLLSPGVDTQSGIAILKRSR